MVDQLPRGAPTNAAYGRARARQGSAAALAAPAGRACRCRGRGLDLLSARPRFRICRSAAALSAHNNVTVSFCLRGASRAVQNFRGVSAKPRRSAVGRGRESSLRGRGGGLFIGEEFAASRRLPTARRPGNPAENRPILGEFRATLRSDLSGSRDVSDPLGQARGRDPGSRWGSLTSRLLS